MRSFVHRLSRATIRRTMLIEASGAGMAELADAADSKSAETTSRGGSTPPPGTNKTKDLARKKQLYREWLFLLGGCSGGCWGFRWLWL